MYIFDFDSYWDSKIPTTGHTKKFTPWLLILIFVVQSDQKQSAIFETVFDNKRYTMK